MACQKILAALLLLGIFVMRECDAEAVVDENGEALYNPGMIDDDYTELLERLLSRSQAEKRRSCIRRLSSCEHRKEDCCPNTTCRCNLFGVNCRCQRAGIFQSWGK